MNLKVKLIVLLLTSASLSAFCQQYPVVKTLGKDTVVIMTLKQGEDINKQFSVLKDSLNVAKKVTYDLTKVVDSLSSVTVVRQQLADSVQKTNITVLNNLKTSEALAAIYLRDLERKSIELAVQTKSYTRTYRSGFVAIVVWSFVMMYGIIHK
jgi:hypothetical protein